MATNIGCAVSWSIGEGGEDFCSLRHGYVLGIPVTTRRFACLVRNPNLNLYLIGGR